MTGEFPLLYPAVFVHITLSLRSGNSCTQKNTLFSLSLLVLCAGAQAQPLQWRSIPMPGHGERVTGIYCQSASQCVISTSETSVGRLYASDGKTLSAPLLQGDAETLTKQVGGSGSIGFLGFSKVGERLIAHTRNSAGAFISAQRDYTRPEAWKAITLGLPDTQSGDWGLNHQIAFAASGNKMVYLQRSYLMETSGEIGPQSSWTTLWSPAGGNPVPRDISARVKADPLVCDADPSVSFSPQPVQTAYLAPDLSLMLYPAGARNQRGNETSGVCISTDGGKSFQRAPLPGLGQGLGPVGVTCTASRCFAYNGLDFTPGSAYIYFSDDAHKGAQSTWTKASLPTLRSNTNIRQVFFVPGSELGWAVGWSDGATPLLLSTQNGGRSWQDDSGSLRSVLPPGSVGSRLHAGYAFDATHLWLGGEKDTLITTVQ